MADFQKRSEVTIETMVRTWCQENSHETTRKIDNDEDLMLFNHETIPGGSH
jgi:hypothetical protein